MNKQMTKAGFKAYLKRTRAQATCGSVGGCVLANYLHTELGYVNPFVCSGYNDFNTGELNRPLPGWAQDVINTFDSLGAKSEGLSDVKTLRAAQYRKPLLAVRAEAQTSPGSVSLAGNATDAHLATRGTNGARG